jgi:hypothetical protein
MYVLGGARTLITIQDTFTRANAATLGSDWTQGGTGSGIGITSNATSWGNGGTSNGEAYALHNTPLATDAFYISHTVASASVSTNSRMIGGADSGLTSYAGVNWFSTQIFLMRANGAWPAGTDMTSGVAGLTIGSGTLMEFYRTWDVATSHWRYIVKTAGVQRINYLDMGDTVTVGPSNRRVGHQQRRTGTGAGISGFIQDFNANDSLL